MPKISVLEISEGLEEISEYKEGLVNARQTLLNRKAYLERYSREVATSIKEAREKHSKIDVDDDFDEWMRLGSYIDTASRVLGYCKKDWLEVTRKLAELR